jgi:cytochrome P450
MAHRTQLYLEDDQYRWLRRRAGAGSIAGVVRKLIDDARSRQAPPAEDPIIDYLLQAAPSDSGTHSTVQDLDRDIYG